MMRTDLRTSRGFLESFFCEDMMNSVMNKESKGVSALELRTVIKKERNGVQKPL